MTTLKKFTLCAVVVLAAGYSESSFGFWSKLKHSIHQRITTAALGNEFLPSLDPDGPKWKFTSEAIERIKEHNAATDHPDVYVDYLHFDNESYDRSYANLKDLRLSLIVGLLAENPSQDDAWYRLGRMLHAVQDYYSHSTWAEDPGRQYIRFGAGTIYDAPRPEDLPTEQSLGGACVDTEGSTEGSIRDFDQPHTTGYYLAGPPQQELQSGDCRHGNLEYHIGRSVAECGLPDQGINQDYDCQPYFPRAIRGAYDSSVELVSSIVIQLAETGNLRGVCILMGIDLSAEGCGGESMVQEAYLKASNAGFNDQFGLSVAMSADGSSLAVGTQGEDSAATGINGDETDDSASGSGAVYVYSNSDGEWSQQAYVKASNTDSADSFGGSISISGDGNTLAVGANQEDSAATGINGDELDNSAGPSGAVYVYSRNGDTWSQQAYVKASNTDAGDRFGRNVALSGDGNTLVVGAINEGSMATGINGDQSQNGGGSGAAYVFVRNGTIWSQQAYVKASNTGASDHFGISVALSDSGNTMAIGASNEASSAVGVGGDQDDNGAVGAGAVYIYTRAGNAWSQQEYVKASNAEASDRFGFVVALSDDGDTLAVSAAAEASSSSGVNGVQTDNGASGSGAVYVFRRTGGSWSQQAYIKASNTELIDQFGISLSLAGDGNKLAVGARWEDSAAKGVDGDQMDNGSTDSGAVYLFTRNGGNWSQTAYVKASNTGSLDQFGTSVDWSANGQMLVIGADRESSAATGVNGDQTNSGNYRSGAAYVLKDNQTQ